MNQPFNSLLHQLVVLGNLVFLGKKQFCQSKPIFIAINRSLSSRNFAISRVTMLGGGAIVNRRALDLN